MLHLCCWLGVGFEIGLRTDETDQIGRPESRKGRGDCAAPRMQEENTHWCVGSTLMEWEEEQWACKQYCLSSLGKL